MQKSILLIGGAGYIGPIVAEELLNDGHDVTVLDSLIYKNRFAIEGLLQNTKFRFINGDMGNTSDLTKALEGTSDVVILAGLVGDPITKAYPREAKIINEIAAKRCIKTLANSQLDRVIFISTCSNYGFVPDNVLASELHPTQPLSLYAKSKVDIEHFLLSVAEKSKICPTILRFATAFGVAPRMRFDLTVNEFVKEIKLARRLLVFDADTWRPYCHVRDFANTIRLVLNAPKEIVSGEIFNAGSEINNFTKRQLVKLISKHLPKANVEFKEDGNDPRNYQVDFSKIRDLLGFTPKYTVEMGILEVMTYIDSQGLVFDGTNKNLFGNYILEAK
jgi:nucleoside-diphosphate-sugar epimerase